MRKISFLVIVLILFCFCGQKEEKAEKVEKIIEGGVEVIVNYLEPYKIKGEPTTFAIEEESVIDTEREDLAELGIRYIDDYDADSKGNIYLSSREQLFKFDNKGNFIKVIGRKGQGPGEYQNVDRLRITDAGTISVYDSANAKFLFFNPDGSLREEKKKTSRIFTFEGIYLDNGNFILRERQNDQKKGIRTFHYILLDSNFEKIKDLPPSFWIEIPYFKPPKISLLGYSMTLEISNNKIFVGSNMKEDLEIEVYDFQGNILKKIRKETERLKIPKEYKEDFIQRFKRFPVWKEYNYEDKHYFPEHFPPFETFWVDEEQRIFVEAYKEGGRPGEALVYIFNTEGVFVGTKSLKEARSRMFKNNRMFCVYRKESGFPKLVVYKVIWE